MDVEEFVESIKARVYVVDALVFSKCEVGYLSVKEN